MIKVVSVSHGKRSCHIVNTELSTIPTHHPVVDPIEDHRHTKLHDGVGMEGEEEANASEDEEEEDIAKYSEAVGHLVDE